MKASVKWTGSSSMVGINDKGQEVKMDWEEGAKPGPITPPNRRSLFSSRYCNRA